MKLKLLTAIGLSVSLAHVAWAGDMESILDEGTQAPQAKVAAKVAPAKSSPLIIAIKKKLGKANSEQNIFLRYLEDGEWDSAVIQFPKAFDGTAFQKTPTGRALFGLVQFNAGLPVAGIQTLFMASNPKEIVGELRDEWQKAAPADHFAWGLAQVQWQPAWEDVFNNEVELRLKTKEALTSNKSVEQLQKLSAQAPVNSKEKGLIDWQLVIAESLNDHADQAAKTLAVLMKNPNAPVSQELMQITAARMLFQNGYFDAAIKYYEKVPKKSEYWTEAQEEMGWAYIRKGEPNNAMAISQSLVNADLNYQVSPEAYFVRSLSQLKVCDYAGVTESLQVFPKRFKDRTKMLEQLSHEAKTESVTKAIESLKAKRVQSQDLGKYAQNLPRRFSHDEKLYDFAQAQKHLEDEAKTAEKLYAKSLALTGLQGVFENMKQNSLHRAEAARDASYGRVKELAKEEVTETKEILRKLHIVEAELIQQVSVADKIAKNAVAKPGDEKKGVTGYKGTAEAVHYPAEEEVWFDELSNYRVDVKKACTVKR